MTRADLLEQLQALRAAETQISQARVAASESLCRIVGDVERFEAAKLAQVADEFLSLSFNAMRALRYHVQGEYSSLPPDELDDTDPHESHLGAGHSVHFGSGCA